MKLLPVVVGLLFITLLAVGAQPSSASKPNIQSEAPEPQSPYVLGDADCDDDIDALDALRILRAVASLSDTTQVPSCLPVGVLSLGGVVGDVDCNRDSNPVDALKVLKVIADLGALVSCTIPVTIAPPSPDMIVVDPESGLSLVSDELLLSLDSQAPLTLIEEIASAFHGDIIGSIPSINLFQVSFPDTDADHLGELQEEIAIYSPYVKAASENLVLDADETYPVTPKFDDWDASSPGGNNWGMEAIRAPSAWDVETGDGWVKVAVIDSGFDLNHEDIRNNARLRGALSNPLDHTPGKPGHGTHVAGTACGDGVNAVGVAGVAWRCDLMLYNPWHDGTATIALVADMMERAARDGARVVNLSLGIEYKPCGSLSSQDQKRLEDSNSRMGEVIEKHGKDVLWVFAAGNAGQDVRCTSPASLVERFPSNTIAVAAINKNGFLRPASNRGSAVSLAAPGEDIQSTIPNNEYGLKSGTSMAAPHVTGLAALYFSRYPGGTAADAKACIVGGAEIVDRKVPGQPFYIIDASGTLDCQPRSSDVLAYVRDANIWLLNPSTGVQRQFTNAGAVTDFEWSHSGGAIAYVDSATLYVQALDSPSAVQISPGVTSFAWSPEFSLPFPNKLAYITNRTLKVALLPDRLAVTVADHVGRFEWAPDGTKIAFFSGDSSPEGERIPVAQIGIADFAGPPTYAAYTEPYPDMLRWSPNSKSFAYRVTTNYGAFDPRQEIVAASAYTLARRVVTEDYDNWRWSDFAFSEDGTKIYAGGAESAFCGATGNCPRQLISAAVDTPAPMTEYLPANDFGFVPYFLESSAFGDYVAFTSGFQGGFCSHFRYGYLLDTLSGSVNRFGDSERLVAGALGAPLWYDWAHHSDRIAASTSAYNFSGCPDIELERSELTVFMASNLSSVTLASSSQKPISGVSWSNSDGFLSYFLGDELAVVEFYSRDTTAIGVVASPQWRP